jgi:hypothetical protein
MREDVLRQFFLADVSIDHLVQDLRDTVKHLNSVESTVAVEDMQQSFLLERKHVVKLCDAALSHTLTSEALTTLAFALMASDHFEWDDDTLSEVLSDWSCPEINFPLNETTLKMHRAWLIGDADPPLRQIGSKPVHDHLVSLRRKVTSESKDPS